MRRAILTIGLAVLFLGLGRPAQAEWVTIQIEGVVDYVEDFGDYLGGQIIEGSVMTGWYKYDMDVSDSDSSLKVGNYWQNNSPAEIYFEIEGFVFRSDPDNLNIIIEMVNDYPSGDSYLVGSSHNLSITPDIPVQGITLGFNDYSGNALSSDALPATAPNLQDWQENSFSISSDRNFNFSGTIYSAVPEPATLLFLSLGTVGLYFRKSHK